MDKDTGVPGKRLAHREEAEKFYRGLPAAGQKVRYNRLGWKRQTIHESEMAVFSECSLKCARKTLDTADIAKRGDFTPNYPTSRWDSS